MKSREPWPSSCWAAAAGRSRRVRRQQPEQRSLERLRYGLWLARETGAPVAFSGGVGWALGNTVTTPEAQIAARIAQQEFSRPLKWTEDRSHDTRENAIYSTELLKAQGIRRVLVVTHQRHMPRALKMFHEAAAGSGISFEAAPWTCSTRRSTCRATGCRPPGAPPPCARSGTNFSAASAAPDAAAQ